MSGLGIREQILQNNPFFSGIASDPWDNTAPDVPSLNGEAYRHLCELVLAKSRDPRAALAGLVLGETGMGKTHLLKRLLRYVRKNGVETLFVSVKPLPNPDRPMRHLLREIAVGLSGKGIYEGRLTRPLTRRRVTQLDYLIDKIAAACRKDERDSEPRWSSARFLNRCESFFGEPLASFLVRVFGRMGPREGSAFLRERCRGIHPRLPEAVFEYSDPRKRAAFLDWLEGGAGDREDEAREVLASLGMLLECCGVSMIVCFDQLDGMREEPLITAFGDIVHFLVNDVKGALPLAFIRLNTWSDRFSRLDPAVTQRLSGNKMFLYACTLEQARELIKVRLESRFRSDAGEKFQWLMERLEGKLKPGYSPRDVIELANREIVHPEENPRAGEPEVLEIFAAEYRKALGKADAEFGERPPDAESLSRALETYLLSRADFKDVRRSADKYISLKGRREDGELCAFVVSAEENHKAVWAALRHGSAFLKDCPDGECRYVSDRRCRFNAPERWPEVYEELEKFREAKGVTLFLNREQAVTWYALAALRLKVDNGDVPLSSSGGGKRAATIEDLALFLRQGFEKDLLEWGEREPAIR